MEGKRIEEGDQLRSEVKRLIKNKIEPLAYKFYVLKSGNGSETFRKKSNSQAENEGGLNIRSKLKSVHRRKALVQLSSQNDLHYYDDLQKKVQNHIALRKINLMEGRYTRAQESAKKTQKNICSEIWNNSLSGYMALLKQSDQLPSQVKLAKDSSCDSILKQISTAKNIKVVRCVEDGARALWNQDVQQKEEKKVKFKSARQRKKASERQLKRDILRDIKYEYNNEGSSKIRINMNHRKMIAIR